MKREAGTPEVSRRRSRLFMMETKGQKEMQLQ